MKKIPYTVNHNGKHLTPCPNLFGIMAGSVYCLEKCLHKGWHDETGKAVYCSRSTDSDIKRSGAI
jgi:hypothetical protein